MEGLNIKLEEARKSGKDPANFTLEETLAIIGEGGGNKALASLLAENAANKDALVRNTGRPHHAGDDAALDRVRQAAIEGIQEITDIASGMLHGYPGDPLFEAEVRLHRFVYEDGGRIYAIPQGRRKTNLKVLVYDGQGAFVRVGLATKRTLVDVVCILAGQCIKGDRTCYSYEEVAADDIFKWYVELAMKRPWRAELENTSPQREQNSAPVTGGAKILTFGA